VDEELISITEVCNETSLQSSALRYYERAGLIRPHSRIGGRRHYRRSVFQTLGAIALLQEVGFTISEIKTLLAGQEGRSAWRALADAKLRTIDDHIERASRPGSSSLLRSPANARRSTRAISSSNAGAGTAKRCSDWACHRGLGS
jgi:DNA-binding transcriptional MerR regulator